MERNVFDTPECAEEYARGYACDNFSKGKYVFRIKYAYDFLAAIYGTTYSLLDVGCATGNAIDNLREIKYETNYVGADFSLEMLKKAKALHPEDKFVQAMLPHLPFPDNSFDTVLCLSTVVFIRDKLESILELFRVARRHVILELVFFPGEEPIDTIYEAAFGGDLQVTLPSITFVHEMRAELSRRYPKYSVEFESSTLLPGPSGFKNLESWCGLQLLDEVFLFTKKSAE